MATEAERPGPPAAADESLGQLVAHLSEQTARLVRDELKLAQLEMTRKGKRAGLGAGLFGGAGVFALYGTGALVAAAIIGLSHGVTAWAAALLVAAGLFVVAGMVALVGKVLVAKGMPAVPTEAVSGLKQDVQTLKPGNHARSHTGSQGSPKPGSQG